METAAELFDRHRRRVLRGRAAARYAGHAFLKDAMVEDIAARVADTGKTFARVLDLGAHDGRLGTRIGGDWTVTVDAAAAFKPTLVADEDAIDKGRIAGRAATLVNDGDVVLLDIGTTTRLLARELFGRPITAVTSSLAVLDELRGDTTSEVVLLGGAVRRQYHSLVGSLTEDALRQVRAATVFLSASGVSSDGAVLDTTLVEMPTKRGLLRAANRVVLLAGSSKFPGSGSFRVCGMDQIDVLVTTHGADPATLKACRAQGTEVLFA